MSIKNEKNYVFELSTLWVPEKIKNLQTELSVIGDHKESAHFKPSISICIIAHAK